MLELKQPKLNLGKARLTLLKEGEEKYVILCTRVNQADREAIHKATEERGYVNIEDFLEDSIFRFLVEKPYLHGYTWLFPVNNVTYIRGTGISRRTGWNQINFVLSEQLANAVKQEVDRLKKYSKSIAVTSYLYTGIQWSLGQTVLPANKKDSVQSKPDKNKKTKKSSSDTKKASASTKISTAKTTTAKTATPKPKTTKTK